MKSKKINESLKSKDIESEIYIIESLLKEDEKEKKDLLIKSIEIVQEVKKLQVFFKSPLFFILD